MCSSTHLFGERHIHHTCTCIQDLKSLPEDSHFPLRFGLLVQLTGVCLKESTLLSELRSLSPSSLSRTILLVGSVSGLSGASESFSDLSPRFRRPERTL